MTTGRLPTTTDLRLLLRAIAARAALLLAVLFVLVVLTPRLSFVEVRALDFLYALRPRHSLDPRIVVVDAEQEPGVPQHRRDPEDAESICLRRAYVQAVRSLSRWGAKVVVVDLQFEERCRQDDPELAAAFREAGNVVVAAVVPRDRGGMKLGDPADGLGEAAWAVGSPLTYRPNGTIRSVPLVVPDEEGGPGYEALCLAAFQRLEGVAPEVPELIGGRSLVTGGAAVPVLSGERVSLLGTGWLHGGASLAVIRGGRPHQVPGPNTWSIMLVNWVGPPGTVPARRLSELLTMSDERGREAFSGKAVLIGRARADPWLTAVGAMPGLEIQANALHTLVSGAFIRPLSPWAMIILLALFIVVTELAVRRLTGLPALGAVLLVMAVGVMIARQLLVGRGLWMYIFSCELGVGLTWGATAIAESGRAAALLGRFVPSFMGGPRAVGRGAARTLDASILFADVRGSTGSVEQRSAAEAMAMLNAYSAALERVIARHGGSIVKTPGDAVLAVFWRDRRARNHATCALQAAEEILAELPKTAKAWEAIGARLEIGIGLNSGPVATGLVGARHLEPTVIGDTVNVAQRLEDLSKGLGRPLILSEAVRERLPEAEAAAAVYLDEVTVRGRRTPVRVYGVEGGDGLRQASQAPPARSSEERD